VRQPITLTAEELVEVTGYQRAAEQLKWFKALGVPAKRRADGTVSVAREHYLSIGKPAAAEIDSTPARPRPRVHRPAA
jgi:hypothetical protein